MVVQRQPARHFRAGHRQHILLERQQLRHAVADIHRLIRPGQPAGAAAGPVRRRAPIQRADAGRAIKGRQRATHRVGGPGVHHIHRRVSHRNPRAARPVRRQHEVGVEHAGATGQIRAGAIDIPAAIGHAQPREHRAALRQGQHVVAPGRVAAVTIRQSGHAHARQVDRRPRPEQVEPLKAVLQHRRRDRANIGVAAQHRGGVNCRRALAAKLHHLAAAHIGGNFNRRRPGRPAGHLNHARGTIHPRLELGRGHPVGGSHQNISGVGETGAAGGIATGLLHRQQPARVQDRAGDIVIAGHRPSRADIDRQHPVGRIEEQEGAVIDHAAGVDRQGRSTAGLEDLRRIRPVAAGQIVKPGRQRAGLVQVQCRAAAEREARLHEIRVGEIEHISTGRHEGHAGNRVARPDIEGRAAANLQGVTRGGDKPANPVDRLGRIIRVVGALVADPGPDAHCCALPNSPAGPPPQPAGMAPRQLLPMGGMAPRNGHSGRNEQVNVLH